MINTSEKWRDLLLKSRHSLKIQRLLQMLNPLDDGYPKCTKCWRFLILVIFWPYLWYLQSYKYAIIISEKERDLFLISRNFFKIQWLLRMICPLEDGYPICPKFLSFLMPYLFYLKSYNNAINISVKGQDLLLKSPHYIKILL